VREPSSKDPGGAIDSNKFDTWGARTFDEDPGGAIPK